VVENNVGSDESADGTGREREKERQKKRSFRAVHALLLLEHNEKNC